VLVAGEDLAKGGGTRPVVATKKGRGEKERKKKGERERWTGEREKKGEQSERNGTSSRRLLYFILFYSISTAEGRRTPATARRSAIQSNDERTVNTEKARAGRPVRDEAQRTARPLRYRSQPVPARE